jgi:hypothetical protein
VGTAFCPEDGYDVEALLAEADRRMYSVKQTHHAQSGRPRERLATGCFGENKCAAFDGKLPGTRSALVATVLLGGLLSATLVRLAPGFDADERELDPHLNAQSVQALRDARRQDRNIFRVLFSPT